MPAKLTTPHRFRERLLIYGTGGVGKTDAALSIAANIAEGHMFVVDNDYSYAYQRALETDYVDAADRVTVFECNADWEAVIGALASAVEAGLADGEEAARDNWLVLDSISPTWEFVQTYITEQITGASSAEFLTQLRKESESLEAMNRTLVDQVPWNIVKKEYAQNIYIPLRNWPGHWIITAEAKKLGRKENAEIVEWYQHLGVQPQGESRIHHVSATTLLLHRGKRDEYRLTTVKDRNREDQEDMEIPDSGHGGFAMSYLRDVAGWKLKVVRDG